MPAKGLKTLKEDLTEEREELNGKITRLRAFIRNDEFFSVIDPRQQELLIEQDKVMEMYLNILDKRISLLS